MLYNSAGGFYIKSRDSPPLLTPSQEKDFITLLAGLLLSSGSVFGLSRTGEEFSSHSTTELLLWLGGSSMMALLLLIVIFSRLECLCLCSLTEARDG